MIKIFKLDPMDYTPFSLESTCNFLRENGIVITNNRNDCDIFVSRYFRKLAIYRIRYWSKKYLVWTHEPRFDTHFKNKVKGFLGLPDVYIMNAYTKDIYLNNYSRYGWAINQLLEPLNESNFAFNNKKIVALMICRNKKWKWSLKKENRELDLCYLRTKIAWKGNQLNKVDIYGKDWPEGISLEDSRDGNWHARKLEILKNYHFNLCFENTNIDYYCTEKIWDSIKSGCLPIYYGKSNKIYDNFPKNSFLDYCDFQSEEDLFEYIERMDEKEFCQRINLCIKVFNEIYLEKQKHKYYEDIDEKVLLNTVTKIQDIVSTSNS